MIKRLFLLLAAVLFCLTISANAQPFAYITAWALRIIGSDYGTAVVVLNLANNNVVATISGEEVINASGVIVAPDSSRAVVATQNSLFLINTTTNKVAVKIHLENISDDNREVAVSPDGRYAYVTGPTSGKVLAVNLENNKVVAIIPVGGKPANIIAVPDGSRLYVSGCGAFGRSLCAINPTDNTIAETLDLDSSKEFAVSPDGRRIYTVGLSSVTVFDVKTKARVAIISLLGLGQDILLSPDGRRAYVQTLTLGTAAGQIAVIDTISNKVIATANAGGIMAISPEGRYLYLLGTVSGNIWVVDTETNTVSGKINLPQSIVYGTTFFQGMAISPGPRQKPALSAVGIVNAAGYQGGGVAAGEIVTIFGSAIGPPALTTLRLTPAGLVDNSLADTRVLFDGIPAPLVYVWQNQNSVVVPYTVAGKSATQVQVEFKGLKSDLVSVRVVPTVPGIFTLDSSGKGQAAALNENMTVNSANNPAPRGSIVVLYATGEGQTNPPGVDGKVVGDTLPRPLLPVTAQIGGVSAEILYAGGAPGLVSGVMQVNARVPNSIGSGNAVPVVLSVGNASSQQGVTIAVR